MSYKRPTDYWCNDDEQVKIIEAALDLYEKNMYPAPQPVPCLWSSRAGSKTGGRSQAAVAGPMKHEEHND